MAIKKPTRKPRQRPRPTRPREKVLIVMHPNGLIEVYAENVDVHFVNRLDVGNEWPQLANLIDVYHENKMPRPYRNLFWPNKLRGIGLLEKITLEDAQDTLWKMSILHGLRELRPVPKAITREKRRAAR